MKKIILSTVVVAVLMIATSPYLLYWWGLACLSDFSVPEREILSSVDEQEIWANSGMPGSPSLRKLSPYEAVLAFRCDWENIENPSICAETYPGYRLTAFAVRNQASEKLIEGRFSSWDFAWLSATIWATNNWNIHQVLSTYGKLHVRGRNHN